MLSKCLKLASNVKSVSTLFATSCSNMVGNITLKTGFLTLLAVSAKEEADHTQFSILETQALTCIRKRLLQV